MKISLAERLNNFNSALPKSVDPVVEGHLTRMVGLTMEAVGCAVKTGDRCRIQSAHQKDIEAEVVGFDGEKIFLMPTEAVDGLMPGSRVLPLKGDSMVAVGFSMLGRIFNGAGEPLDEKGPLITDAKTSLHGEIINPLKRHPIRETLNVGVKAINGLLTVGQGQRMGLFAGSGVGKSVLLGMMTRYTDADITIVGLIGERGREVKEFIEDILGEEGLARSVVVASPADDAPLMRLRAAMYCTAIAEYFRAQGKNVLLLMDSLTRYAQAQREIALAVGEPPATKGYPPSVFAKLPKLVERAGNAEQGKGSITAFYTVLTEGDDLQDPIADAARAILDGHIVLSRRLAEEGHYPAIDIESSISRAMPQVIPAQHLQLAQRLKQLYSYYQQNRDLISVGAYSPGSDKLLDQAVERLPYIQAYLQQRTSESESLEGSSNQLQLLMAPAMK